MDASLSCFKLSNVLECSGFDIKCGYMAYCGFNISFASLQYLYLLFKGITSPYKRNYNQLAILLLSFKNHAYDSCRSFSIVDTTVKEEINANFMSRLTQNIFQHHDKFFFPLDLRLLISVGFFCTKTCQRRVAVLLEIFCFNDF